MIVIHKDVAKWVMQPLGKYNNDMQAIGQWDGDKLIAGVAFESQNTVKMWGHCRCDKSPSKQFWMTIADYIFNQCKVQSFSATVDAVNSKAIRLNKNIGFEIEAILKNASDNGDLLIMTLTRDNCRFLKWIK